jgi:hypothetical protein
MTHARCLVLSLFTLIVIAGCAQQPTVRAKATAGIDFSRYRTYAIRPGNIVYPGASEEQRTRIGERIQNTVGEELESRGLTAQPESPDLIVTYTASAQAVNPSEPAVRAIQGGNTRGPGGNPYDEPGLVQERPGVEVPTDQEFRRGYTEGNLLIDLLDGKNRRLVWRAMANAELASDQKGKRIEKVITQAFEQFPISRMSSTRPSET